MGLRKCARRCRRKCRRPCRSSSSSHRVLTWGGATLRRDIPLSCAFVYLSPTLEKEHCINATWAVAHELAHVTLGHGHYRQRIKAQVDADEKAASDLAGT